MDKTKQFITLECYHPYYTVNAVKSSNKNQYTPSYEDVSKHVFYTKIRLDMISRVDAPDFFTATPKSQTMQYFSREKDEHKDITYQRVVVTCSTSNGINGFQDSLYITERCISRLQKALDEAYGCIPLED